MTRVDRLLRLIGAVTLLLALLIPVLSITDRLTGSLYERIREKRGILYSRPDLFHSPPTERERELIADTTRYQLLTTRYDPVLVWLGPAYSGPTMSTDSQGFRVTPGSRCDDSAAETIYFFGGSTMFGLMASDDETIPAHFVSNVVRPVCVRNFGVIGHSSLQEMYHFLRVILSEPKPDAVVFLDGINDIFSAYQSGTPGQIQNSTLIADRLEHDSVLYHALEGWRKSATRLVLEQLRIQLGKRPLASPGWSYSGELGKFESLAQGILRTYLVQVDIVRTISLSRGIRSYFYWQPSLPASGKKRTEGEEKALSSWDPVLKELFERAYGEARSVVESRASDVMYLGGIFDHVDEAIFTDPAHVTGRGNDLIAEALVAALSHR